MPSLAPRPSSGDGVLFGGGKDISLTTIVASAGSRRPRDGAKALGGFVLALDEARVGTEDAEVEGLLLHGSERFRHDRLLAVSLKVD